MVYVPGLEHEAIQLARYPVLYLLDGDRLFGQTEDCEKEALFGCVGLVIFRV